MQSLCAAMLARFITLGTLRVQWPDGSSRDFSGPPGSGPHAAMRLVDARSVRGLALNPALAVGESYMEGTLEPLGCTIYDVIEVLLINVANNTERHALLWLRVALRRLRRQLDQFNPAGRARRNVAHHYDLDGRLYSLFLDRDWQYSCAYFPRGDETLEAAQAAKKRHIAAKLRLDQPDLSVLDIGCGWGGMAITLARDFGARVLGITLSEEQLAAARARAETEGLADRVRFELCDYRAVTGQFDRIVSVGMFEHVGVPFYRAFFDAMSRRLTRDGVALLHAIGRNAPPGSTNPWLTKYIFPGGYCPAVSEVLAASERSGLLLTDVEILRLHYAETLRHWRRRFAANRDTIASLYDERFCRMFEFYLAGSELSFRRENMMVFQMQFAHDQAALPLTRDYMARAEAAAARVPA